MLIPFIDRSEELSILMRYAEVGHYPIFFIFGPEGCGKTRLLKEFIKYLKSREDYLVTYLDALESSSVEEALVGPKELLELAISTTSSVIGESVGSVLAKLLPHLIRRVFGSLVKGKHVVIAVDDVARPLGTHLVETYTKKLLDLTEWLLSRGATSVLVIATSSEGSTYEYLYRHNYVNIQTLWNLSEGASYELLKVLKAPEELWRTIHRYSGGNPRTIIELSTLSWSKEEHLRRLKRRYGPVLQRVIVKYSTHLKEALEDIDTLINYPELTKVLIDANLVTPITRPCLGTTPPISKELGIGRYYAWKIPAYRELLKEILEELHSSLNSNT